MRGKGAARRCELEPLAIAQDQDSSSKDGLTEATFAYWSAVRME